MCDGDLAIREIENGLVAECPECGYMRALLFCNAGSLERAEEWRRQAAEEHAGARP